MNVGRIGRGLAGGACALLCAGVAAAQCTSIPYPLTNGTPASASQVMGDFQCAALTGNGLFSGNVGIDTTTPADSLDVNGQVVIGNSPERLSLNSGSIGFNRRVSTGQIYNPAFSAFQWQRLEDTTPANDYLLLEVFAPSGAVVNGGAITVNGNGAVAIGGAGQLGWLFTVDGQPGGAASWAVYSDARLKTNIAPLKNALATVLQLQGVSYNWLPPASRSLGKALHLPDAPQVGFIAQDVAKVVPEAVVAPADPQNGLYGLMESKLIPLLVEAIKAQQAEITALQAQVAKLQ